MSGLQKQPVNVPFGQGLDTKTDPNQVMPGKFISLENGVFNSSGLLAKRNGFGRLVQLPDTASKTITTYNGNLIATGSRLRAYSADTNQVLDQGPLQPLDLKTEALVRTSTQQTVPDSAVAASGLICVTYLDGSNPYYQVSDSSNGQQIVQRTALPTGATDIRVCLLGAYFIITFKFNVSGNIHLRYIAVPTSNPSAPTAPAELATSVSSLNAAYDICVANQNMYYAWDAGDGGGAIRLNYLSARLTVSSPRVVPGYTASLISMAANSTGSTIACTFWASGANNGYTAMFDRILTQTLAPTLTISGVNIQTLTSAFSGPVLDIFYQNINTYSFSSTRTDFISKVLCTQSGTVTGPSVLLRSVGLASKAFVNTDGSVYMVAIYAQAFQPTLFIIDSLGNIIGKIAYSNAGGYTTSQVLPSVSINGNLIQFAYLIKDLLVSVNKTQGATNVAGIYSQTGINLATININEPVQYNSEIANNLHLTGGFLWMYDSVKPVEHSFHVWPEDLTVSTSRAGGSISAQQYYYQFCYEWTDAKGNLHRSAPSIPVGVVTGGATSTNTINVPTLRLTYKTAPNSVRLVGYRWSAAQQNYYQFTSIQSPVINNPAADSIAVIDTLADSAILGNTLLYTTGGVLENIAAPACSASTLWRGRLWLVDAEDRNLLWYSKPVVPSVPVEFSDLQTVYVSPTTGAQGSTGDITALASMDDKLIPFKASAAYYLVGNGPDVTGANNDFSDPIFITAAVGCANQRSIVLMPDGLMFQTQKGIWMLGRNLSTSYIGAPVELYNDINVNSAVSVPNSNEVRFTFDSGDLLMYDYFNQQWGLFSGVSSLSSTVYNGQHTTLNSLGLVQTETPGVYLDDARPVLLSFKTAWIKLTGLQGYQRAYFFYILSNYLTPHTLSVNIGYDYSTSAEQSTTIRPTNFSKNYGADNLFGSGTPYGGPDVVEQWRVFLSRQKCQSLQIEISEFYDASKGASAGAGLTFSGLNFVIGAKKGYPVLPSSNSAS